MNDNVKTKAKHDNYRVATFVDGLGIRLDVYLADENHTVYDIEMQTTRQSFLPKRSRFYQSVIDLNMLEKGSSYAELKKSFVIFICLQDPFDKGYYIYHFQNICKECPELELGDGTYKIFLNAKGSYGNITDGLKDFLSYLCTKEANNAFLEKIEAQVHKAHTKERWRDDYMTINIHDFDVREEGREIGLAEGRVEGGYQMVLHALKNASEEQVKSLLNISDSDITAARAYEARASMITT